MSSIVIAQEFYSMDNFLVRRGPSMHFYNILSGKGYAHIHLTNGFSHKDLVKSFIDHLSLNNDLLPLLPNTTIVCYSFSYPAWPSGSFDGEPHKVSPIILLEQEYCLFSIPDWDNSGSSLVSQDTKYWRMRVFFLIRQPWQTTRDYPGYPGILSISGSMGLHALWDYPRLSQVSWDT